jgi:4-hydroxythreonine-4-phosphate dehydrogenase
VRGSRRIAISMGDPTGIGPEVTLGALARPGLPRGISPILVGDLNVYRRAGEMLKLPLLFAEWTPSDPLPNRALPVLVVSELTAAECRPGRPTTAGGRAAHAAILEAARLVRTGRAAALVTAPICKANLVAAGADVPGHTELLAALCGTETVRMMMVGRHLRVVLTTTHLPLARVPETLSQRLVFDTIVVAHRTLRYRFGIARPRIGVTGLNPHAGEGGLFGSEDGRLIAPAIRNARGRRIDARGPLAADSSFAIAASGGFDAVVCMYHDQGLGPFKLMHFADGVNFTAGLPIVRTSPDHGTAHDIAGKGLADPTSMSEALRLAARLSRETMARHAA